VCWTAGLQPSGAWEGKTNIKGTGKTKYSRTLRKAKKRGFGSPSSQHKRKVGGDRKNLEDAACRKHLTRLVKGGRQNVQMGPGGNKARSNTIGKW